MSQVFEHKGYTKDFYVNGKYLGSCKCECDREVYGYAGRITEVLEEEVLLSNKKKIKAGTTCITELSPIYGRIRKDLHDKFRKSLELNK